MADLTRLPQDWIASYAYATGDMTIPIASLSGLTAAEAAAATGDIAEITRTFLEALYQYSRTGTVAERPVNFVLSKSVSTDADSGELTITYIVRVQAEPTDLNVIAEPV